MTMNKILNIIMESNKIGITFHTSPDGDSLGSSLGLLQGLKKLNKDVYILSKEKLPDNFKFLSFSNCIHNDTGKVLDNTECVIVLDCGNLERVNAELNLEKKNYTLINIDHHMSNEFYGDLNFVDTNSACMGEIVYKMLSSLNILIDKNIAECLYTSILTDTGSFRHSNTTSRTHSIAGDLINTGIEFSEIHRKVFDSKDFYRFKLYALVFEKMQLINQNICVMELTNEMFQNLKIDSETDTSDIVSFGNQIATVEVTVLFKEKDKDIKISLRSKSKVDVRKIAETIGGGGHIRAAGAKVHNKSLEEVKNIVIKLIKKELMK
ncbi:DHH family phosphoesterase [Clostridium rectalis]|uniref:DHH family phosphoesterase n=1 Tax=Clostridium rectalis TaxID=2040295 RepID=UPI000F633CAD|nr:bifunctional oligoribonuclease/PAP phosphatase NrnA [Clostridium rectalis]